MSRGDLIGALVMAFVSVVLIVLIFRLMWRGWHARERRQADAIGELPSVPDARGPVVIEPSEGLYVGSIIAGAQAPAGGSPAWLNRIAVGDLGYRADAIVTRYAAGILLERSGAGDIWIPAGSVIAIRTAKALAGKVLTHDGILAIRWRLPSGTEIDTGFLARPRSGYDEWRHAS